MRRIVLAAAAAPLVLLLAGSPPADAGSFAGRNGVIAFASAGDHGAEIYTLCPDGSRLRRFIKTPEDTVTAYSDWSPNGRTLAFDSDRSGNVEIYLKRDNGRVRRLTHSPSGDSHPTWSPHGRRLAFESDRSGVKQVWRVPASGGAATAVTAFGPGAEEPAWSPTGKWIAFLSGPERHTALFVVRLDGTGLRKLTKRSLNAGHPSWSPDGRRIVFNSNIEQPHGRIWTVNLHGTTKQITHGPKGREDFEPTYSPDAKYIAFSRYTADPGHTDIWVVRADGTGAHDLAPGTDGFDVGATWAVAVAGRCGPN